MSRKMIAVLVFMLFSLLIVETAYADSSERCSDSRLVHWNDSLQQILKNCGEPAEVYDLVNAFNMVIGKRLVYKWSFYGSPKSITIDYNLRGYIESWSPGAEGPPQTQPQSQESTQTGGTKIKMVSGSKYNSHGVEYFKNGQYKLAINEFTIAISLENNSSYYFNRGHCFYQIRQFDKAILDFKEAINLAPKEATAYAWCGNSYYARRSYSEASEYFSKAIAITPKDGVLYLNRGYAQFKMGNKSTAASDFKRACQLGNDDGCKELERLEKE